MFSVVQAFAIYYVITTFALGYGTGTLHYSYASFLGVQLGAIGFMAIGVILSACWSDVFAARKVLMASAVMTIAMSFLLGPMMGSGSLFIIWGFLAISMFVIGFTYGPIGAFLPSLFPARVRYTGSAMAFNIGGIVGGGLTPFIAQSLAKSGGLKYVGYYLAAAGLVSLLAMIPLHPRQD